MCDYTQFLCCGCVCTFCVIFCGLKSQSHSDDGHVHATVLYTYLLTIAPQCLLLLFTSYHVIAHGPLLGCSSRLLSDYEYVYQCRKFSMEVRVVLVENVAMETSNDGKKEV